jgi:hypothetical protein
MCTPILHIGPVEVESSPYRKLVYAAIPTMCTQTLHNSKEATSHGMPNNPFILDEPSREE